MIDDDDMGGRFDDGDGDSGGSPLASSSGVAAVLQLQEREINQQVATARRYPRDIRGFIGLTKTLVIQDEETAQECIYALPKRKGSDKEIIGPSVRFAELVGSCWGNSRYASRVVDEGEQFVTAQGVFQDLERNIAVSVEVQRRIVGTNGRRYGIDMIGVTSSAAMSIALRNAILKGIPGPMWKPAYTEAYALIAGTFESVEKRRDAALKAYATLGFEKALVLEMLGLNTSEQIEPKHMLILRGTLTALRDGDTTAAQVFGSLPSRQDRRQANANRTDIGNRLQAGKQANEGASGETNGDATSGQSGQGSAAAREGARTGGDRSASRPIQGASIDAGGGSARGGRAGDSSGATGAQDRETDGATRSGAMAESPRDGMAATSDDRTADAGSPPVDSAPDGTTAGQQPEALNSDGLPAGDWKPAEKRLFGNIIRDLAKAAKAIDVSDVEDSYRESIKVKGEAFQEAAMGLIRARADSFKGKARAAL